MAVVSFDVATTATVNGPCGLSLGLPTFGLSFGFKLPSIPPFPALPSLNLAFKLSCDPSKPLDISAGVPFGGGRTTNIGPDPDLDDSF